MSVKFVVGVLALAGSARAQQFAEMTGSCGAGYCDIQTAKECANAAVAVGLEDTTPRERTRSDQVAGCSTTKSGSLRFNADSTSTVVHNTGNGQTVLCQSCTAPTTTTSGPGACMPGMDYCYHDGECPGSIWGSACPITTQADCEAGAAMLGHTDTVANVLSDTNKIAGCSINNGGGLRFNTMGTTTHNTGGSQSIVCGFCPPCETDAVCQIQEACDGVYSCSITTQAECEAAAVTLGLSDTSANSKNDPSLVTGCSVNNKGGLRFNSADTQTPHIIGEGRTVVCQQCPSN